jgi:GAF domain-containing protein
MVATEVERIKSAKRFDKFDFALNNGLLGILHIAANLYEAPAAFITLLEEEKQIFKVNHGFDVSVMPRNTSFCTHTIMLHEPLVVSDALKDARFADIPLVKNEPNIRFYAGAALSGYDGQNIGTICVMDNKPKEVSDDKKKMLIFLAKQAIHLMELELNYRNINDKLDLAQHQNVALKEIAFIQSYEFRQPLGKIKGLIHTIRENHYKDLEGPIQLIEEAVNKLDKKIEEVEQSTEKVRRSMISSPRD